MHDKINHYVLLAGDLKKYAGRCYWIQAGSSIKPQIASEFNVHAVFERDPEIVHTSLMCSCRAFYESFFFFFFHQMFGFLYFFGYLGLRDPTFPAKKNKNNFFFIKGSAGAH